LSTTDEQMIGFSESLKSESSQFNTTFWFEVPSVACDRGWNCNKTLCSAATNFWGD